MFTKNLPHGQHLIASTNPHITVSAQYSTAGCELMGVRGLNPHATADNPPAHVISGPQGVEQSPLLTDWETSAAVYH